MSASAMIAFRNCVPLARMRCFDRIFPRQTPRRWFAKRKFGSRFSPRQKACTSMMAPTLLGVSFMESLMMSLEYHIEELTGKRREPQTEEDRESEIATSIKRAVLAMWRQEYNKAEKILHVTLKMAQDMANRDAETYIFDLLANVYYQLGNVQKSESLFREVMQREMQKGKSENDLGIIEMSLKMAQLYAAKKEYDVSQDGMDFCLGKILQKLQMLNEAEIPHIATLFYKVIDAYANFYLSRGGEKQCLKLFDMALSMCDRYVELLKSSPEYAHLLNNTASVLMLQGDFEQAQQRLEEAVSLIDRLPDDDVRGGAYLVNLGQVYLRQGNFMSALEACRKGTKQARAGNDRETEREGEQCLNWVKEKRAFAA